MERKRTRGYSPHATSALSQFALEEAKLEQGGQQWYDSAVADPLLRFLKDKRDISIHEKPVNPGWKMTAEAAGFLNIGDDDDGVMIPYPHTRIVERYEFQDRPGDEVIDLSQRSLALLEALVEDGSARRWITG